MEKITVKYDFIFDLMLSTILANRCYDRYVNISVTKFRNAAHLNAWPLTSNITVLVLLKLSFNDFYEI